MPAEVRRSSSEASAVMWSAGECLPRRKLPDGTWAKAPDADWVIWKPVLKEGEGGADR